MIVQAEAGNDRRLAASRALAAPRHALEHQHVGVETARMTSQPGCKSLALDTETQRFVLRSLAAAHFDRLAESQSLRRAVNPDDLPGVMIEPARWISFELCHALALEHRINQNLLACGHAIGMSRE